MKTSTHDNGAVDVAPGTLENLWRNASGGTGTFLTDMFVNLPMKSLTPEADITAKDIAILRNFYGSVDETNDASLFYERRKEVNEAVALQRRYDSNDMERAPEARFDALTSLAHEAAQYTKRLSEIRKQEIEVALDESLTRGDRTLKIKEIKAERNELVTEFNASFMEAMREARDSKLK